VLERAGGGHLEDVGGPPAVVLTEHLDELGRRPGVGEPLHSLGVGVEGRGEATFRGREVAQQEAGRLVGDPPRPRLAGGPPQVQVDPQQQRVVVEHLLEVRHHPVGVDGVAREPAGELVVDAAAGHRLERAASHAQ
jgi:hypothetical protein